MDPFVGCGVFAILAVGSGLLAEHKARFSPTAEAVFEVHETMAFITVGILFSLLFWRIGCRGRFPEKKRMLYLFISIIGVMAVFYGAYLGGELVYKHGINVGRGLW
ncbi:MAG: hypothetical protein Kow0042_06060 [Calditrichia bacterium]